MQKFQKYLLMLLISANYLMCVLNLFSSEYVYALNEFTIGTLFMYVYFKEKENF